jgi:signal transduction histidine kinase
MSLRMRLILLSVFALLAAVAAVLVAARLVQTTKTFVLFQAETDAKSAARELARSLEDSPNGFEENNLSDALFKKGSKTDLPPHVREILRRYSDSFERLSAIALHRFKETSGGFYDLRNKRIFGFVGDADLPPEAMENALDAGQSSVDLTFGANKRFLLAIELTDNESAAFAVRRVPDLAASDAAAFVALGVLGLAVCAAIGLAFVAVRDLRSDTRRIKRELTILEQNLGAKLTAPQTPELRAVVFAVNELSANLRRNLKRQAQLENELRQNEKLSALGRIAAGVAHEIRNPLAAIKLKIQIAERRPLDAKLADAFRVVREEIERLDKIVERLLVFSKAQTLERADFDLAALLRSRAVFFADLARRQNVAVNGENLDQPIFVNADKRRLTEVFDNLIQNALNAMPTGGKLTLTVARSENFIRVRVADNGAGISEPEKIFEPFFTTRPNGTGLGLAIAREIVAAHKGKINFETSDAETVFVVEIPI